jgi:hypothetical protein
LKRLKLVARPPRHSRIKSIIELILGVFEVNGEEIEASASDNESPASACFKAPQSFAPSPHIAVIFPIV